MPDGQHIETRRLDQNGEARARIQSMDWSGLPIGRPDEWPETLRIPLDIALGCSFPVVIWHEPGPATFFNDAALPIFGALGYGAMGLPAQDAFGALWREIGPVVQEVLATGKPGALHGLLLPGETDGARRCFRFSLSPICDQTGSPKGVHGVALEVADRTRCDGNPPVGDSPCDMSVQMRLREQRLSAFLEHSNVIGFLKDAQGRYEYLSPTFEQRYKIRQSEWSGKTDFDVWPAAIAQKFVDDDRATLATGAHLETVECAPDPDGAETWWLTNKFAFRDESGQMHVGGLAVDVTSRQRAEEALRKSEEKRKLGAAVAGLALAEVDYKADRIHLTEEAARLYGFGETAIDLPRTAVHATFHPDDRAEFMTLIKASLDPAGAGGFGMDHRILLPDGATRWLRIRKQVFFQGEGAARRPSHAMLAAFDVTIEKEAGEAVFRNETFVREVLDSLPQQVAVLDGAGTLIAINESWRRFGLENGASLPTPLPIVNYLDVCRSAAAQGDAFAQQALNGLSSLLKTGDGAFVMEYPCDSPTAARWFVMHARRSGSGLILSHTDITQQKAAEAAARESEQRFRAIAEMNPDAILVSVDGRYVFANRAAVELLEAKDVNDILGLSPFDIVEPPFHDLLRRRLKAAIEDDLVDPLLEYRWVKRTGAPVDVEVATGPVSWFGRRGVQAVARDITERKRVEAALRDADQKKDEFLATLAHELRNPLAPIANGVQILLKAETSNVLFQRRRELLMMMQRQASHLVRLVDDLLEISRISRGKIDLKRDVVDCAVIVSNAIEACELLIEERGHRLTSEFPSERLMVEADPIRLTQVIANLINNAANYTEREGRIHVRVQRVGNEAVISVSDNGIGISPEMLPKVFGLFTQLHQMPESSQHGLGIGLALVRQLIELHGGRITARSDGVGRGSEFAVYLTLVDDPEDAPPHKDAAANGGEAACA